MQCNSPLHNFAAPAGSTRQRPSLVRADGSSGSGKGMWPWLHKKLYALIAWSVLIHINSPSVDCRLFVLSGAQQKGSIDFGILDLNRYRRGPDLTHIFVPGEGYSLPIRAALPRRQDRSSAAFGSGAPSHAAMVALG